MIQIELHNLLIIIGVPSIITFVFAYLFNRACNKVSKDKETGVLIQKALQAILRDKLRSNYTKYKRSGYIDVADKENYQNMYQAYHGLGENGVMDNMYNAVINLPLTSEKPPYQKRQTSKTGNPK